ncbi:hypothetical protein [Cupriavidus plantarum]|uniref:Uncharacterized protein n=1 Tax=Cupriavidus plantarum TaxID=942865 RepID=A0A316EZU5_9BURK|nr:hypothetical protein [Cupriavidus plantarum]NYH99645.1 hypothetical protein [Cupriavidus plantarum]PWK36849.1 hypothetical protein C7419_101716 [Cupriavidus plantarum]REF02411.1 hypothetical protein C7418_1220 [Cupriavidus plantarum]RLK44731.1 hypothetical protein C7417_0721 [Cupriavidus plantarum]CAG2151382.1 hypothetical protein LMG26296_04948 [Cupriavidus plantarum]
MWAIDAACAQARAWTGPYPAPAGIFEVRPRRLPCDALPVYDDELGCVVGYLRTHARRGQLMNLDGDVIAVWACNAFLPEPDLRDDVLVVGGLWTPRVRGMTPLGIAGSGAPVMPNAVSMLRQHFMALAQEPLFYTEAALARMQELAHFVPVHILRLALRHGDRLAPPAGLAGVARYSSLMWLRRVPHVLDVATSADGLTILRFEYWHYAGACIELAPAA